MRNNFAGAAMLSVAVLVSSVAVAGEKNHKHTASFNYAGPHSTDRDKPIRIVRWGDSSRGGNALIRSRKNSKEALSVIKGDRTLAAELHARGVEFKNIAGMMTSMDGHLVIYIK